MVFVFLCFFFPNLAFAVKDENLHLVFHRGRLSEQLEEFNFLIRHQFSGWLVCGFLLFISFVFFSFVFRLACTVRVPTLASALIDAPDCRPALGDAGPLLVGIKARGIWL